jgi:LysR family glycine cleavage system transcriptional activator
MYGVRQLVRQVDRLQRLAVFEAAARLGSLSAAGRELGIAQPAVTRQIKQLEVALDTALFDRQSNRVALTAAGRALADSLDVSFAAIEHTLSEVTDTDDIFVLAMPPGFAQQLVLPVLDSLQQALGERDLRLWLYDRESELANGSFHAAVRVSARPWPGHEEVALFGESVFPVATPGLAATYGLNSESPAADVLATPLLHMDSADRPWMSWADWLARFDLRLTPGRRRVEFNSYPSVLQAVMLGRGVALGWAGILDELLDGKALVVVGPTISTNRQYTVTWPSRRPSSAVEATVAWLAQTSAIRNQ